MSTEKEVRELVRDAYAKAVQGKACCGSEVEQKGSLVCYADYDKEELSNLPKDAVSNSFGCGNPLAFAEVKRGETVLDLGSGAGMDLLIAAEKVGEGGLVIGVDMTDEMIEKARQSVAAAGLENVEIRKGLIEDLPVESARVDWVISNCVINLSPEKEKVFSEIARVLKPGGRLRVSDLIVEDFPAELRNSEDLYTMCIAGAISEKEYISGLEEVGLNNVRIADRLFYDTEQLEHLLRSECTSGGCDSEKLSDEDYRRIAEKLDGKVASALIVGQKEF